MVEHHGEIGNLPDGFELSHSTVDGNSKINSEIRIMNGAVGNDLLKYLIDKVDIISFVEKIPTMNECCNRI